MNESRLQHYRKRLLALRARLRGERDALLDEALSERPGEISRMPTHMADAGSDAYEKDSTLALSESAEETLALIEAALARIEDGTYGICSATGRQIPEARLNAIPWTSYCVEAANDMDMPRYPR